MGVYMCFKYLKSLKSFMKNISEFLLCQLIFRTRNISEPLHVVYSIRHGKVNTNTRSLSSIQKQHVKTLGGWTFRAQIHIDKCTHQSEELVKYV